MKASTSASDGLITAGPYGSSTGKQWEDRDGIDRIAQIFISYGESTIKSLQFNYLKNGNLHLSERYGGSGGVNFKTIDFDLESSEYITWVSGRHHRCYGLVSLTIGTNKSKYGPFGGK
ncbi:PREDICTED: inactive protein RESTRICTED TEV MOVEMENT 1-like isoform X2 [Nelumbo nucifera]|uniref:Inactive protein RESTRICTED TEV MOVEMENT 1-like isoform X2 n=1 Tax=Nelumbo nucifera TaxID=4432 RepID=A0A1U8QAD6_NELNU|nr:PREDICTED: inactive protein RESTRICTED TEV MOVEMENT 1-like isoform X2 [Nelumbo nucifera]